MAIPTTSRVAPVGYKMPEGFKTVLAWANVPGLQVWAQGVKITGQETGGMINTTTQEQTEVRTQVSKKLKTWKGGTWTGFIDPDVIPILDSQLGKNQAGTLWLPTFDFINFYGCITDWEPAGEWKESEPPLITLKYEITNTDPMTGAEAKPEYHAAAGT